MLEKKLATKHPHIQNCCLDKDSGREIVLKRWELLPLSGCNRSSSGKSNVVGNGLTDMDRVSKS